MSQDMYVSESGEILGLYVNKITLEQLESFSNDSENPITLQKYVNKNSKLDTQ